MSFSPTASDAGRNAALCMLGGALLCYGFAAFGWMGLPTQVAFVAMLAGALWSLAALRDARARWLIAIVLVLVVIALGSPTDEWDPRSIWLFHARRIFLDGTLYAQLDGYAPFSHNDYPTLVPLLMATSAKLVGHWNELFPKAAATLLLLPALLLIARTLRAWWVAALFAFVVLKVGGTWLADGYMDALVGVYAVASLATALSLVRGPAGPGRWKDVLAYVLVTAVLGLTKNEGLVLAVLVAVAVTATHLLHARRFARVLPVAVLVALLPLLAWKLTLSAAQMGNDLASSDLKGQLLARLPNLSASLLILKKLFRDLALLPLLVMLVCWRRTWGSSAVLAAAVAGLAYAAVLHLVYLGTPHDLSWHLATSASRTVVPVMLLLMYGLLVLIDEWRSPNALPSGEREHA